jgi:sugar phosphate isomerase/epimerase
MTMTIGACTYSWLWDAPLTEAVRRIADMGFNYFELMSHFPHCWPRGWSASDRKAFRQLVDSLGLRISSVNPTFLDINIASPNPGIRDESVRQLRETIQLAHDIGAGIVVAPAGRKHKLLAPDQSFLWGQVKKGLETLLADCERLGVTFGLENAYNVVPSASMMAQVCRELPHPKLKLVYDVANATMVESPLDGLDLVAPYLALLHFSDTDQKVWGHDRIGTGAVDFAAVTAKVRALGYEGPAIMEIVDRKTPEESNRVSLQCLRAMGWTT